MAYNKSVEGKRFTLTYDSSIRYFRTEAFMVAEYLEEHSGEVENFFGIENIDFHTNIRIFSSFEDYATYKRLYLGSKVSPTEVACTSCGNIFMMTKNAVAERRKGTNEVIDNDYLGEIALHEFSHVAHHVFDFVNNTGKDHPTRVWLREGIATYLGNRSIEKLDVSEIPYDLLISDMPIISYGYYYSMVKYMIDNYSHEEMISIIKDLNKIDEVGLKIYNELCKRNLQ